MSVQIKKNIFYALAAFSTMLSTPGVYAKINPLAFKRVTQCFKKGKESFSPTVGEAALESGLLYDLRFYGNFDAAYESENDVDVRSYINDSSDDPVWNVIKCLFPSSGGQLSAESTHSVSFGKAIDRPESMSILLNFVNDLEEGRSVNKEAVVDAFLATLSPVGMGTQDDYQVLENIIKELDSVQLIDGNNIPISKAMYEDEVKNILKSSDLTRLQSNVLKKINEFASARVPGSPEVKLENARGAIREYLQENLLKGIRTKEEKFKKQYKKESLAPLISFLEASVKEEGTSIYPQGTT